MRQGCAACVAQARPICGHSPFSQQLQEVAKAFVSYSVQSGKVRLGGTVICLGQGANKESVFRDPHAYYDQDLLPPEEKCPHEIPKQVTCFSAPCPGLVQNLKEGTSA